MMLHSSTCNLLQRESVSLKGPFLCGCFCGTMWWLYTVPSKNMFAPPTKKKKRERERPVSLFPFDDIILRAQLCFQSASERSSSEATKRLNCCIGYDGLFLSSPTLSMSLFSVLPLLAHPCSPLTMPKNGQPHLDSTPFALFLPLVLHKHTHLHTCVQQLHNVAVFLFFFPSIFHSTPSESWRSRIYFSFSRSGEKKTAQKKSNLSNLSQYETCGFREIKPRKRSYWKSGSVQPLPHPEGPRVLHVAVKRTGQ